MVLDSRFLKESGSEIFTGTELLVKGALETPGGVHLLTGYPGSPISGFFDTLQDLGPLLNERGIVARIANNEALSVAMVNGAQMAGCRAITVFKSVGLHVASDALALGVLAGTRNGSGGLIIVGDDPWSDSTQVPADSRFLAEHLRLPIIEPASNQEIKDWVALAFELGRAGQIYIAMSMTTALADGGGTVFCRPNHYPTLNEHQRKTLSWEKDIEPYLEQTVLLPPRTWQRELGMDQRLAAVCAAARRLGINRIVHRPQKDEIVPLGFIAAGHAYAYLAHALYEMGLHGRFPILKLGMHWPVDPDIVLEFARSCRQIIVVEERRSFVERQVAQILQPYIQSGRLDVQLFGKHFPRDLEGIPSTRGLNPSILIERLAPLIRSHPDLSADWSSGRLSAELARIQETARYQVSIPPRTPTFCPGCPHRDTASVLLELRRDLRDPQYMLTRHKRKPVDLVCHGDTGCYTMLMFEPTRPLMHNYSGMGLGGGTGSGVDPFIDNKQIVFMGDSTFFHSGLIAISHSIQTGQDITYIILDNKTTAMTGHQGHPGVDRDLRGNPIPAQDILKAVEGLIPPSLASDVRIIRTNPADRDRYRRLLEDTILSDGVKIVIADKECGITYHRRIRAAERRELDRQGFLSRKTYMNIATEACDYCLECTRQTGCPGLKIVETDYGPKIQTDLSWCVNDGACYRIYACPSFEQVTVIRRQPPRAPDEKINLADLPEPPKPIHADQEIWRCYLAGVGGMGIGLATAILCQAGHEMGYHVQFFDKKGLAVRSGGVYSQIVFTRLHPDALADSSLNGSSNGPIQPSTTPLIPYGKADLLLGIDLLEAVRAIDPAHPYRVASPAHTAAVVNTAKTPTILTLMGRDDFDPRSLEETLRRYTHPDHFFAFNVGDLCERILDTKLYANLMILGIAYQKGFLPLTLQAIETAIRKIIRHETERNLRAFNIGRKIAVRPDLFTVELKHESETARQAFRRKVNMVRAVFGNGRRGRRIARQFRVLLKQTFRQTQKLKVDDQLVRDVIIRAYDCLIWGGLDYARRYCNQLVQVFQKDDPSFGYAITRAAVWNLAKVMLIKDEIYVAALLTSPEKYRRDRHRFNVNPALGDRIIYRHYNRPEFTLLGHRIRFNWVSRDWQLRLLARCRFLRHLLPSWHRREREFRDWYESLLAQLEPQSAADPCSYAKWLAIVSVPASVTGYREVRYPRMEAARQLAQRLLATPAEQFPPAVPTVSHPHEARLSLPLASSPA